MTTAPEIVAFVRTGEERTPRKGEWFLTADNDGVCRFHKDADGPMPRFIFLPIPATHPKAADILALVPKPKTLGERVAEHISVRGIESDHLCEWLSPYAAKSLAALIDRLAAEGKGG